MSDATRIPAIEAQGVHYAYPDGIVALDGLTFHAAAGELVAVMGANGAGKTTLLKVLMRLVRPQQGQVRLAGTDVAGLSAAELYRAIGMVFQNPADQLFAATVEQDVAFGPRNLGLAEAEVARRVQHALSAVDALPLRGRPVHHLSFGQQKRVCLAGVLAMQPAILVLDEPTAGLDPQGETQMIELLLRLNRQENITLILATHCVDLLPVLATRIYVLREGRVHREGPPETVLADAWASAEAGLRLPLIAQLFHELRGEGLSAGRLPLTIPQARRQIRQWVGDARPLGAPGERP
ncbi:MAG: energy-coupling factor ABC transporter ATP-binding protein [Thermoguttaceae bacterium]